MHVCWHNESNLKTVFSCYLYLALNVHSIIFSISISFSKLLHCRDLSSLIHNSEFPLSTPQNWEHLTVIKCILLQCAAMWLTCRSSRRKWLVFANFGYPWITISLRIYVYLLAHCHDNFFLSLLLRVYKCIGRNV